MSPLPSPLKACIFGNIENEREYRSLSGDSVTFPSRLVNPGTATETSGD
jgi:hypothetical protein